MKKEITFKVLFKNGQERIYLWNYENDELEIVVDAIIQFKQMIINSYKEGLNAYVEIPNADGGALINVQDTCGVEFYGIDDLIPING